MDYKVIFTENVFADNAYFLCESLYLLKPLTNDKKHVLFVFNHVY